MAVESARTEKAAANGDLSPRKGPPSAFNLPNAITLSRLVLAVVICFLIDQGGPWLPVAGLFIIAVISDAIDGYLARKWGQITQFGRIVDPLVDKLIIIGTMLFLQNTPGSGITPWMTLLVLGREMLITSLRTYLEQRQQDFSAAFWGKIKMICQSVAVAVCLVALSPTWSAWPMIQEGLLHLRTVSLWAAMITTAGSGVEYGIRAAQLIRKHL